MLLVAGMFKLDETRPEFDSLVAADPRVKVFGGFIENDEMQLYLEAADIVVLPYREILNSGSAILALTFDRPVLLPAQGSMTELARETGSDWVLTYEGQLSAAILADALAAAKTKRGQSPSLAHLDWRGIAEQTLGIYSTLLSTAKR